MDVEILILCIECLSAFQAIKFVSILKIDVAEITKFPSVRTRSFL